MTTALSTTYTALKASISGKELAELRIFEKVKFKLYKAREDKKFLTTCVIIILFQTLSNLNFQNFTNLKLIIFNIGCSKKKLNLKIPELSNYLTYFGAIIIWIYYSIGGIKTCGL